MEAPNLGHLITNDMARRDAIHVAVAPVTAGQRLQPGQHVGLDADRRATSGYPRIGIVDPFLIDDVEEGQEFWLCLYPNTITGLRHVWTHPAFAARTPVQETPS